MSNSNPVFRFTGALLAASLAVAAVAPAQAQPCGICATQIVIDTELARCFLDRYPQLAARTGAAVVVDLEDCETDRGVVAALRPPQAGVESPTLRFIAMPAQLACIKARLEEPGIVLDPSLTIDLSTC